MSRFERKVALVTGGGTGIGRAVVESFVAEGGKVVVVGRRKEPLASLAAEHADAISIAEADVSKPEEVRNVVEMVTQDLGRLDTLVNNAGVGLLKPLVETTDEELSLLTEVNINGGLRLIRETLPLLTKGPGSIVNISSTLSAFSIPGTAAYAATKSAVDRFTRTLAAELGSVGVRVNAVAPGLTKTDMAVGAMDQAMFDQMSRRLPWGVPASPRTSPKRCSSWPATTLPGSPAKCCKAAAASCSDGRISP